MENANTSIEDIQKDMILKANIKDICTLLDTKSSLKKTF